ncbi:MAG: ERF family protein [Dolichospermum sp.]|nr:ERF family protein [Dolichospermum sp.]
MQNLFQKINDIQKKVKTVHKGGTVKINERSSYSAVLHDDVTGLLHDPIATAGIVAVARMDQCELEVLDIQKTYNNQTTSTRSYMVKVWASVTFINSENPEERFQTQCFAYAIDSGDKASGKAYSMAIKYCYLKTFMLESMDDEESRDYENNFRNVPPVINQKQAERTLAEKPTFEVDGIGQQRPMFGAASDAQKNALKKMNIQFNDNIAKQEASELIAKNTRRN